MLQIVKGSTAPSTTEPDLGTAVLGLRGGGIHALRLQEANANKVNWDIYQFVKLVPLASVSFLKNPGSRERISNSPVLEDALATQKRLFLTIAHLFPRATGKFGT